jgi:hypothetical protein
MIQRRKPKLGIKDRGPHGTSLTGAVSFLTFQHATLRLLSLTLSSQVHHFFVPLSAQSVTKPRRDRRAQNAAIDKLEERERSGEITRYRVFGMTARILVDAARVAYDEEPEFEHNSHFGDEDMIAKLRKIGRLDAIKRPGEELTRETMRKAAKLS